MDTGLLALLLDAARDRVAQLHGVKPEAVSTEAVLEDILATLVRVYLTGTELPPRD